MPIETEQGEDLYKGAVEALEVIARHVPGSFTIRRLKAGEKAEQWKIESGAIISVDPDFLICARNFCEKCVAMWPSKFEET